MVQINFVKTSEDAKLPTRAHSNDTGWDVYCTEDVSIFPGAQKVVPIGLKLGYITPGFWILVACRSGLAFKHGLAVHGGVIDENYRGSLDILFRNLGDKVYHFKKGDKIAQLIVYENYKSSVSFIDTPIESDRGEKGFGSSGT